MTGSDPRKTLIAKTTKAKQQRYEVLEPHFCANKLQGEGTVPRAHRHFLPDHVWHITHRCHQREKHHWGQVLNYKF